MSGRSSYSSRRLQPFMLIQPLIVTRDWQRCCGCPISYRKKSSPRGMYPMVYEAFYRFRRISLPIRWICPPDHSRLRLGASLESDFSSTSKSAALSTDISRSSSQSRSYIRTPLTFPRTPSRKSQPPSNTNTVILLQPAAPAHPIVTDLARHLQQRAVNPTSSFAMILFGRATWIP